MNNHEDEIDEFYFSQEFFNEIMDECEEEREIQLNEERRMNNRLMNVIRSVKGEKFYDNLRLIIQEVKPHGSFEFSKFNEGQWQSERYGEIRGYWVSQSQADDSGDSFYGQVYVKLKENKYLMMFYAT